MQLHAHDPAAQEEGDLGLEASPTPATQRPCFDKIEGGRVYQALVVHLASGVFGLFIFHRFEDWTAQHRFPTPRNPLRFDMTEGRRNSESGGQTRSTPWGTRTTHRGRPARRRRRAGAGRELCTPRTI